jgi:phospholipid N-methyltransferase
MSDTNLSSHRAAFFRTWLKDPFNVASIVPSGAMLAKQMAKGLLPGDKVIELGAGTGTVTRAILDRGVRPEDLFIVERNADFAAILRRSFPGSQVFECDADAMVDLYPELLGAADVVVSGLPILWFQRSKKLQTLAAAFAVLRPQGRLHQFTYMGRAPVGRSLMRELGLRAKLQSLAPLNLPPAYVYRFSRVCEHEPVTAAPYLIDK